MSSTLKLTKLVLRQDGRYDCEVSVKGYWQREYNKVNKNGTEYVTGVKSEEYHKFTKNQKVVMVVEEKDLGEDLCKLMDNVRDYIDNNPAILEQLKQFETVSLQVDTSTKDEVGGIHDSGEGWNPQGVWCGECSSETCKGCVNEHATTGVLDELKQSPEAQQAACDSEQCSFPECDHACGYNPDKDDPKEASVDREKCPVCGGMGGWDFGIPETCYMCEGKGYL